MEERETAIRELLQRLRERWAYSPWALLTPEERAARPVELLLLAWEDLLEIYADVTSTLDREVEAAPVVIPKRVFAADRETIAAWLKARHELASTVSSRLKR